MVFDRRQAGALRLAMVVLAALAWIACAGAGSARADASITASASGPSDVPFNGGGTFTITVTNNGDATAHGVQLSVSFPNVPTSEGNNGDSCPIACLGNGHGSLVATVGDMAPGTTLSFSFGFTAHSQTTLNHPWTVSSTDAGTASGTYSLTVDALPPPPAKAPQTTLSVAMSDPVKITGLLAGQTVTLKNTGANTALNVRLGSVLDDGSTVRSMKPTAATCTNANPIVVMCSLAKLAPGATETVQLTLHLPVHPSGNEVNSQAYADNAPHVIANARGYFLNRYWSCICASALYANGWKVPGLSAGYTIDPDDTVHLTDGFVITPDGVLHFPDGRTIVVDAQGTMSFVPAPVPGKSTGPKSGAGSQAALKILSTPKIQGVAKVGGSLKLQAAAWNRHPSRVALQWQTCTATGHCQSIRGSSSTLKLTRSLAGKRVRVIETAWFGGTKRQAISRSVLVRLK